MAPLQPIPEEESTPSRLEGVAIGLRTCEDAQCRAIAEQYRGMVLAKRLRLLTRTEVHAGMARKGWDFLSALSRWQESASGERLTPPTTSA